MRMEAGKRRRDEGLYRMSGARVSFGDEKSQPLIRLVIDSNASNGVWADYANETRPNTI